ncbi:MAG: hypothetical protein HRU07_05100 [Nitrosopumilus sp.]|nr:hypothetical protein [Nitrosopumilus sp.]NRA05526.1 hypothetical protein [Nitrosopumilus sp.]
MRNPRNHAKVGYSMILVAASLAIIGIMALFLAEDVLFADNMQRDSSAHFNECKANDFSTEDCQRYCSRINTEISGVYTDSCE